MNHQCTIQATFPKCPPSIQLPNKLASVRATLPKYPKPTASTTRIWPDPFQFHHHAKIMEQSTSSDGS